MTAMLFTYPHARYIQILYLYNASRSFFKVIKMQLSFEHIKVQVRERYVGGPILHRRGS